MEHHRRGVATEIYFLTILEAENGGQDADGVVYFLRSLSLACGRLPSHCVLT